MNWRDTKMRGPRPSVGRVNRYHGSDGPGAFGYGRSGTLNEGQNHHNSYIYPLRTSIEPTHQGRMYRCRRYREKGNSRIQHGRE